MKCRFGYSCILVFQIIICNEFLFTQGSYEFPESVKPENYHIKILGLIDELKFEGTVDILAECKVSTNVITLHAAEIIIDKDKVSVKEEETLEKSDIMRVERIVEIHWLLIKFKDDLSVGKKYIIHIEYQGILGMKPYGFYISPYEDEEKKNHTIATSFFEPNWARYAFPCFDLPHMKATFDVTVGRSEKLFSLSNMPLAKSDPIEGRDGWFWDHFEKTVPMSTYLVAFTILDYGMRNVSSGKIRIWFPPLSNFSTEFVLGKSQKMLHFLEEYFGIEYELPKLDYLLVNNYPAYAAAEENWGLVSVHTRVLKDERFSITVFGHEMIHQWFGNMVTMKCFGELWLKEGTTTYFTTVAQDMATDGETMDIDVADHFILILKNHLGNGLSTGECSDDIEDLLDFYNRYTFFKGALFVRMILMALGLEDFRKTSNSLLTKYRYLNFDENDFYAVLKNTIPSENFPAELDINIVLKSWTKQDGFPLVIVSRNYETGTAELTQRKFYFIDPDEEITSCWWIPISYTTKSDIHNNTMAKFWMNCPKRKLTINNLKSTDWILTNLQSTGYFIVKYDDYNWKLLTETLLDEKSFRVIPYWNRFRLILDSLFLSDFGLSSHESLLTTLLYLKHETEFVVWFPALKYFSKIDWLEDEIVELKNEYMKLLVQQRFSKRMFDSKKYSTRENKLNKVIIREACLSGVQECIDEYFLLFGEFKTSFPNESLLDSDLRGEVFCIISRLGTEENKQFLIDIMPRIKDDDQLMMQVHYSLTSPSCSKTPLTHDQQIKKFRTKASQVVMTSGTPPRYLSSFDIVRGGRGAPEINGYLKEVYKLGYILEDIRNMADHMHDPKELQRLERYFENNKNLFLRHKKETDEIIRKIKRNVEWKKNYSGEIKSALLKILGRSISTSETSPTPQVPDKTAKPFKSPNGVSNLFKSNRRRVTCSIVIFMYVIVMFFE